MGRSRFALVVLALILLGTFLVVNAQQAPDATCPALIDQALNAIGTNCNSLNRNSACYGYRDVEATFTEPAETGFFTQPSDRAELLSLQRIGTSPLDLASQNWGIALLSLQANLPDSLPGQNTMFMLLGDTQVENAVRPEDILANPVSQNLPTVTDTPLFSFPAFTEDNLGSIPAGTTVAADALSLDGQFVRVTFGSFVGWVSRAAFDSQADLSAFPAIDPYKQSPMQTFYLRTNVTGTHCTEAPDSLVVQGPQDFKVDLNVNGADIQIGSTIAMRVLMLGPDLASMFRSAYPDIDKVTRILELVVIDGHATLNPGTDAEIGVDAGYRTYRCLSEPEDLGLDSIQNDRHVFDACPWLPPQRWRQIEYDTYQVLEGVDLNYIISMPEFLPPTRTATATYVPVIWTSTPTFTPTDAGTPTYTSTPSDTPTFTPTSTPSDTPTYTPTFTPTYTDTYTPTFTPTYTDTPTSTPTYTPTYTPSFTATYTDTPTSTLSSTPSDTPTYTSTYTPSFTATYTDTPTDTPTATETPTDTPTYTETYTETPTDTPTATETPTDTPTFTETYTETPTDTPTATDTPTDTSTPTDTPTDFIILRVNGTPTLDPEATGEVESSGFVASTKTVKPTVTRTPSYTPSPTVTFAPGEEGKATETARMAGERLLSPLTIFSRGGQF